MITKENAIKIGTSFIGELIISNAYRITEEPENNWNIYNCPKNCYFINISNIIDSGSLSAFCCSLVIAIDKTDGRIRYFGSAYDEG
jgi:hypothetical protein